MSKVRNISGGGLIVPLLDNRLVEAGEVVDVPDFQPAHNPGSSEGDPDYFAIVWPGDKWEPVPEPKVSPEPSRRRKAAAAASDTGSAE